MEIDSKPENGSLTNGNHDNKISALLTPHTHAGLIKRYSSHRRWINTKSSWSRISSENKSTDRAHSTSASGSSFELSPEEEATTYKCLIAQLCHEFYGIGWATGTSGGISIRSGTKEKMRVFCTPSGVMKEDLIADDIFELDSNGAIVTPPATPSMKLSASTPLWYIVYNNRPNVKAVIHTHSINSTCVTLLNENEPCLKITHLEMIKGVGGHAYNDVLEIPIIENRPTEDLLSDQLEAAIRNYPKANAVLVRRHGLYVWGDSWEQAKTHCETFEFLFEACLKLHSIGVDFSKKPAKGTFPGEKRAVEVMDGEEPAKKKMKADTAATGFHGKAAISNQVDLECMKIPLLPLHAKILLLDIEGCTTSISFVKETLFPYVLKHLDDYVEKEMDQTKVDETLTALEADVQKITNEELKSQCLAIPKEDSAASKVKQIVKLLMSKDIKATGLKALQGNMWKAGYHSKALQSHVYDDFVPLLKWCSSNSIQVNIYSSGSINAQKLLFGHTTSGDLNTYITNYFDTTSGPKVQASSYKTIAEKMGVDIKDIVFVSDAEKELVAAREAGMKHVIMSVRPGNAVMTDVGKSFPNIYSLLQLCGA